MIFQVELMPIAEAAIDEYINYIAIEKQSPEVAERVLERIRKKIKGLKKFPHAASRAPEDALRDYLIRYRQVDNCLILYNVNDYKREVRIIGFRHGSQLPRLDDLPENL